MNAPTNRDAAKSWSGISGLSIYHILLDRFAGDMQDAEQPVFAGGNLAAAAERLEYIADLGFNAVWLSPFFQSAAYHGYHITDFYSIDRHFGNESDLTLFVDKAHALQLKVFADFVPNHLSRQHPYFKSAQADCASPYRNWFCWQHWPDKYRSFLYYDEIPKIDMDNSEAREHIIGAAIYWAGKGIDGLRIDHAIGPSLDFNREFYQRLKNLFPDIFIFGEVWAEGITRSMFPTINIPNKLWRWVFGIDQTQLQRDYRHYFDAILDFSVQKIIVQAAKSGKTVHEIQSLLAGYFCKMPAGYTPVCFLDNHDMDRFIWQCGSKEQLKSALAALAASPAPIAIYYGTESGIVQHQSVRSGQPYADLAVRQPMNWDSIDVEMHAWVKLCLSARAECRR